jgi:hypothetical protein
MGYRTGPLALPLLLWTKARARRDYFAVEGEDVAPSQHRRRIQAREAETGSTILHLARCLTYKLSC